MPSYRENQALDRVRVLEAENVALKERAEAAERQLGEEAAKVEELTAALKERAAAAARKTPARA